MGIFDLWKSKKEGVKENMYYCPEGIETVDINIKVLGSCCNSGVELYENAVHVVKKEGIIAKVEYITDIESVVKYGVISMPGLVINEEVVSVGKELKADAIEKLLLKSIRE